MTQPRILFFINGSFPTIEQQIEAEKLVPAKVSFRNANHIDEKSCVEKCDGWCGTATPAQYRSKFPSATQAIETYKKTRENELKLKNKQLNKLAPKRKKEIPEDLPDQRENDPMNAVADEAIEKAKVSWKGNADT